MKRALANSVTSVDQFPRRHELGHGSLVAAMPLNDQSWECPKQLFKPVTYTISSIPVVSAATSARPFYRGKGRADVAALTTGIDRRVYVTLIRKAGLAAAFPLRQCQAFMPNAFIICPAISTVDFCMPVQ